MAEVFGQPIFYDEMEPDIELRRWVGMRSAQSGTLEELAQWEERHRKQTFLNLIHVSLDSQYRDFHDLNATPDEAWALLCTFWEEEYSALQERRVELVTWLRNETLTDSEKEKIKRELEFIEEELNEGNLFELTLEEAEAEPDFKKIDTAGGIAWGHASAWKFNKALFEEYGGKVLLNELDYFGNPAIIPFNIPDPCEARRVWMSKLEETGELVIYDPETQKEFLGQFLYGL